MVIATRKDAFGRGHIYWFERTADGELVLRKKRVH